MNVQELNLMSVRYNEYHCVFIHVKKKKFKKIKFRDVEPNNSLYKPLPITKVKDKSKVGYSHTDDYYH